MPRHRGIGPDRLYRPSHGQRAIPSLCLFSRTRALCRSAALELLQDDTLLIRAARFLHGMQRLPCLVTMNGSRKQRPGKEKKNKNKNRASWALHRPAGRSHDFCDLSPGTSCDPPGLIQFVTCKACSWRLWTTSLRLSLAVARWTGWLKKTRRLLPNECCEYGELSCALRIDWALWLVLVAVNGKWRP